MLETVYFLTHKDTMRRLRYYRSLAGARIAQRIRNRSLGFDQRVERVEIGDNWEVERCELSNGEIVDATYCIQQDVIDHHDLTELGACND